MFLFVYLTLMNVFHCLLIKIADNAVLRYSREYRYNLETGVWQGVVHHQTYLNKWVLRSPGKRLAISTLLNNVTLQTRPKQNKQCQSQVFALC